jgi:hypothetical protein
VSTLDNIMKKTLKAAGLVAILLAVSSSSVFAAKSGGIISNQATGDVTSKAEPLVTNQVPDGGTTALLLGIGAAGLLGARRISKRKA